MEMRDGIRFRRMTLYPEGACCFILLGILPTGWQKHLVGPGKARLVSDRPHQHIHGFLGPCRAQCACAPGLLSDHLAYWKLPWL